MAKHEEKKALVRGIGVPGAFSRICTVRSDISSTFSNGTAARVGKVR
jgi:hypothetical protein